MAKINTMPFPTTGETLAYHLKQSLIASGVAKPAGTTWGEFKQAGDQLLTDDTPVAFIEFGVKADGLRAIERCDDEDPLGVGLREL
jgi:hypothetical protein